MGEVTWSRRNVRGVSVVVPAVLCIILGQGCRSPEMSSVPWFFLELEKWSQMPIPGWWGHSESLRFPGSLTIFFIWVENTSLMTRLFKLHWCFLVCYQQTADFAVVSAHNPLVLDMVALLDYQQVACMVWLCVSLSAPKPLEVHSIL